MSTSAALYGSLGLYALLNFFLVPTVRAAWKSDRTINKVARAGLLAALSVLARFALIASVTLLGVRLALWAASLGNPTTVAGAQRLLRSADALLDAVNGFKGAWGAGIFIFSFVIAGIAVYRFSKAQLAERFGAAVRAEAERLRRARTSHSPEWKDLPVTPEMKQLWEASQQISSLRDSLPIGSTDRAKFAALHDSAIQNLEAMDVSRRMNIDIEMEMPPASTRLGRFWQFLSSSGFYADLKGAKAFVSVAANVLLVVSLLSLSAGPAVEALQNRKVRLEDIVVQVSAKQSRSSRDQIPRETGSQKPPSPPPTPVEAQQAAPQEEQGLRYLAAAFERSVTADPVWRPIATPEKQEIREAIQREWTRVAVRKELNPALPEQASVSSLFPADQWKSESEAAGGYVQSLPTKERESAIRKTFIADWKRENIEQFKDMGKKLRNLAVLEPRDYRKLGWSDLHEWAVGEVIGAALDEASPEAKSEFAKQLLKAGSGGLDAALQNYYKIRFNQFVVGFAKGDLQGAQNALLADAGDSSLVVTSRTLDIMARDLNFKPDTELLTQLGHAATQLNIVSDDKAHWTRSLDLANRAQSVPEAVRTSLGADAETIARSFPDYSSYFPLQGQGTLQSSLLSGWGAKVDATKAGADAARSASFGALENYSGVGGVLIGHPASGTVTAGIDDIDWNLTGQRLTLDLRSSKGTHTVLGPVSAVLAYQALLYATDSRPTAVTAITDKLTSRDRVLLHPALEDTALGCRMIQADHWVFNAVEPGQGSPAATERKWAEYQVAVYNYVAQRLNGEDQGSGEYPKEILDAFNAPGVSPLALSQFNSTVVSAINECVKARDLRRSCPGSHLEAGVTAKPVVANYFVSHLREQDYEPDPGLAFLTGQPGADAWPFNFFILLPVNDTESWYVRDLQPPIADQVLRYLQSHGTTANLEEMKEFTVLQRLFRTALGGRMDTTFPVERMAQLAHDLRPYVPTRFTTPRWGKDRQANDSVERRFAGQLDSLLNKKSDPEPVPQRLLPTFARMRSCSQLIHSSKSPEAIAEADWLSSCSFRDAPRLALQLRKDPGTNLTLADIAAEVITLRQFRAAIVKEGGTELNCPPPPDGPELSVASK